MTTSPSLTPIALTIAGSDSGGCAGIQADLKAFSALGVFGCSAIASLTAQNTLGVQGVLPIDPAFVALQIRSVLSDLTVGAIKTGMLGTRDIVLAVADELEKVSIPLVIDPVMVATSGDRLLTEDAIVAYVERLFPIATLITPNLNEAAALTHTPFAKTDAEIIYQGECLLALGVQAVLMKGGHGEGNQAVDILMTRDGSVAFSSPRLNTKNTHGTGCTLASAITAGLAKGLPLSTAVGEAKNYLASALAAADRLSIGKGAGPVHHFHAFY
jgi:hydroxymethylpyrimidine/phosphomethylpyrimidine kinase